MAAADELALLIQSRYPLIAAETIEEHRFQRTLLQVAESLRVPFQALPRPTPSRCRTPPS